MANDRRPKKHKLIGMVTVAKMVGISKPAVLRAIDDGRLEVYVVQGSRVTYGTTLPWIRAAWPNRTIQTRTKKKLVRRRPREKGSVMNILKKKAD